MSVYYSTLYKNIKDLCKYSGEDFDEELFNFAENVYLNADHLGALCDSRQIAALAYETFRLINKEK